MAEVTFEGGVARSARGAGLRPARLGHVALAVGDLERSTRFYTEVVGLVVSDRMAYPEGAAVAEAVWLRCDADHHCLALFAPRDGAAGVEPGPVGLHHFAFQVAGYEDLLHAHHALQALGIWHETRLGGPGWQLRVYFRDPDGNLVELYWDQDQVGWDGRPRPYVPVETIPDLDAFDLDAYLELKASHGM